MNTKSWPLTWSDPRGGPILILGRGISGRGAARLLRKLGYRVLFFDTRGGEGVYTSLEELSREKFQGAVVSPGLATDSPVLQELQQQGVPLVPEVTVAADNSAVPYVGITGSNGKSTVTALLAQVLTSLGVTSRAVGNIGESFSGAVVDYPETQIFAVEFSSFQLEHFAPRHRPQVGILLNLSPDHLNRHGSMDHYLEAKLNLLRWSETVIYNADDPAFRNLPERLREWGTPRVLRFSRHAGNGDFHLDGDRLRGPRGLNLSTETMKLKGPHNALNALAVLATLQALDLDPARAAAGLSAFQPLPHRLETVGVISGITFVNDSKATNSDAVVQALSAFPDERVRLLAGGILKTDNLEELREPIERKAAGLYLFGRDAKIIARELAGPAPGHIFTDLPAAFRQAVRDARTGDVVLLSPITASFDQYRDFQARGEHFRRLVEELRKERS